MKAAASSAPEPITGGGSAEKNERSHSQRNGLLCAFLVGASLLATYPVAEMGIVDDWSYTKSALDFARTGHLLYNGWATAMLGWQIPWAALFIKLFGFSFTIVRFSMLPIAMASVYLFHRILVRFGITSRLAVFGALTLGLSPLFIPLAASFMTDVPGLFVILLCLYMCQRAVAAGSDRSALVWLCSAAIANVAGGTVRQIAWLGALVMVPSTAWLLRRRRGILPAGIALGIGSLGAVLGLLHWFNRQPYSVSEQQVTNVSIHVATFGHLMALLVRALLCLLLVALPILIAWLFRVRQLSLMVRVLIVAIVSVAAAVYMLLGTYGKLEGNIMPWLNHVIAQQAVAPFRFDYMLGSRPLTLDVGIRVIVSLIVIAAGLAFAEQMLVPPESSRAGSLQEMWPSWRDAAWLLGPFTLSYACLLLPRGIQGLVFDRYLLAPMAVAIFALLKIYQQEGAVKPPSISWVVLAVFACYTIAATHDWFSLDRARVFAVHEIQQSGVPRTEIQGGFDYDGWTQIETAGHVNLPYIVVPAGAYDASVLPQPLAPACQLEFSTWLSAIKPKYFLVFSPMNCLSPSKYPAVGYRAWLPPFRRRVYIQQFPGT